MKTTRKEDYIHKSKKLEKEIIKLEKQLNNFPPGRLFCRKNGKWVKWYIKTEEQSVYLKKEELKLAEQLAQKKYISTLLNEYKQEKKAIDYYLKHHCFDVPESYKLLTETTGFKDLLSKFYRPKINKYKDWMNEDYEKNTAFPEFLVHKTTSGNVVRSKSEVLIDMMLCNYKIPFRYECALHIGMTIIYPDFTIKHPKTGNTFYWEHFGRMDDPEYRNKAIKKLQTYSEAGIIPGVNLIMTFETQQHPLNTEIIKKTIEFYLT